MYGRCISIYQALITSFNHKKLRFGNTASAIFPYLSALPCIYIFAFWIIWIFTYAYAYLLTHIIHIILIRQ